MCGRADSDSEQPAPHHLRVGAGFGGNCLLHFLKTQREGSEGAYNSFFFVILLFLFYPPRIHIYLGISNIENIENYYRAQKTFKPLLSPIVSQIYYI